MTRPALPVALATAASLLGDTLLYSALPVSAARLGLSPVVVGLALSLNRWVRLVTNPIAGRLYERFPAGILVALALVFAVGTTAAYALPAALALFFGMRLAWGFCWSILRLGSSLAALDDLGLGAEVAGRARGEAALARLEITHGAGRRLGEMRATFGLGYLAGAVYAPFAVESFGWAAACLGAAALTLAFGLWPVILSADWRRPAAAIDDVPRFSARDGSFAALFVVSAIQYALYSGLLPVAGGLRVAERFASGAEVLAWVVPATFIAGGFALSQRLANVVWSFVSGRLVDRAMSATFVVATLLAVAGIVGVAAPVDAIGFVIAGAFAFFAGVTSTIAVELAVARRCSNTDRPRVLAAYNTWADLGAAAGALGGGVLALAGTAPALLVGAVLVAGTLPLWMLSGGRLLVVAR